jgi:hypothetical protein
MVEFRGKIKEFYSFPLGNFIENAPRRAKLIFYTVNRQGIDYKC